jgi:hypothetical protein
MHMKKLTRTRVDPRRTLASSIMPPARPTSPMRAGEERRAVKKLLKEGATSTARRATA